MIFRKQFRQDFRHFRFAFRNRDFDRFARPAETDFRASRFQKILTERHAHRVADEIRVFEFDSGAFVSIVQDDFVRDFLKRFIQLFRRCHHLLVFVIRRDDDDLIRRNRDRPDNAVVVVALLNRRRHRTRHANPVAAHDHRLRFPVLIQIRAAERRAVFRAQLEDLPDFDAFFDLNLAAAFRADVFFRNHPNRRDAHISEISRRIHMDVMHILFVSAAARVLHFHDRRIDDDIEILHLFEADGADVPGDKPATRQIFLGRHRDRFRLVQMLQEHFIHLVIAAHHRQHHRVVQFVHDRLHRLRDRRFQIVAHHLNRMLPGRRHEFFLFCIYNAFGNGLRHRRFRIRRKIAMFAIHDIRFPAFRERLKFVRETVSNRAAVCQDRTEMQAATRENPRVRIVHRPILAVEPFVVRVKRVAILHDKFAAAHETETRAQFVAIFIGNLIQGNGKLLVRRRIHMNEHRHELLMRRPHAIFAPVPIL